MVGCGYTGDAREGGGGGVANCKSENAAKIFLGAEMSVSDPAFSESSRRRESSTVTRSSSAKKHGTPGRVHTMAVEAHAAKPVRDPIIHPILCNHCRHSQLMAVAVVVAVVVIVLHVSRGWDSPPRRAGCRLRIGLPT